MWSGIDRGWYSTALGSVALIITLFSAGCNTISDPSEEYAENAHVEVTGTSPVPLLLVSSTNWVYQVNEETGERTIGLVTADTLEVQLPVERTVALAPTYRILFRIINPDSARAASVRMRVRLDGDVMFDETATMRDAALEYSFNYR